MQYDHPVPRRPIGKSRTVRVGDRLWDAAVRKAEREGRSVSEVIRALLAGYVGEVPSDEDGEADER
jgi:predicted HicB family RNase H-like nuclease